MATARMRHLLLLPLTLGLRLPTLDLARELQQLAAYSDAAQAVTSVAVAPNEAENWRKLGKLLHGKGRLEAATRALGRAVELDSQDTIALVDLANAERSIGRFDKSTAALLAADGPPGASLAPPCRGTSPALRVTRYEPVRPALTREARDSLPRQPPTQAAPLPRAPSRRLPRLSVRRR